MIYAALLVAHSALRWIVLLAGLFAFARGVAGWSGRLWSDTDARAARLFVIVIDLQFTIGLLMYLFFSPVVREALQDVGGAMRDPRLRFFLVEHIMGMVIAAALAHVGAVRIKKAASDLRKHRTAAIFFGLSLLAMLLSIPWPGTPAARPLWTWF